MNRTRSICISVFLILFVNIGFAQIQEELPDGVEATTSFYNEVVKNYQDENALPFALNGDSLSVLLPVRVFIIRNKYGMDGVSTNSIYENFKSLNLYFQPIGIHFFVESIVAVNDYNYAFYKKDKKSEELIIKYASENKINLFLVDSVKVDDVKSYGFTFFPDETGKNYIFLDKLYVNKNALATLMGHFMGLFSTHETIGGYELVNENNCKTSGDFICDTYADPWLYKKVDDICNYLGYDKDINQQYYIPSVANLMSDAPDHCRCGFTPLQYRRMYYYFLKFRQNLTN